MILFCIPYAGASATIYYKWKKYLDCDFGIYPIELAGRGSRFAENFYKDINEASDDIFKIMLPLINQKHAIFGHSMGGILAYEVYKKIIQNGCNEPSHVFFSSCFPPNIDIKRENISKLPDDEFLEKILLIGGTTKELVYTNEFKEFYLPVLRNDIKLLDDYKFIESELKISCPVTVLNGSEEEVIDEKTKNCFKKLSSNKVNFCTVSGNHFFVNDSISITQVLKLELYGEEKQI